MARENENGPRFSLLQLLALVTFAGVSCSVLVVNAMQKAENVRLNAQLEAMQSRNDELKVLQSRYVKQQDSKLQCVKNMLFHAVVHQEKFPELVSMLNQKENQQIQVIHTSIGEGATHSLLYFRTDNGVAPLCQAFIIQNEPFQIVDSVAKKQTALPRYHREKLVFKR